MGSTQASDDEWRQLCDSSGAQPWMRPEWIRSWHDAFGRGALRVVSARDSDGSLTALVPLEILPDEHRSPTNYHSPAFGLVARDEAAAAGVTQAMLANGPRRVSLGFVPAGSRTRPVFARASRMLNRDPFERVLERCPFLEPDGDWDGYLRRRRRHMVRELRRRRRGLERLGRVTLEVFGDPDGPASDAGIDRPRQGTTFPALDARLDEVLHVEASGWKGERGTAIAGSPATQAFYRRTAGWLHANGWLRLAILRHEGRPIAVDFAVEADGVHSLLKTGYDPSLRRSSPGMLLREAMLRRAFERGLRRYDFLGNADAWKREWTELTEPQVLLQSFSGSLAGHLDAAAQRHARPIARRLLRA